MRDARASRWPWAGCRSRSSTARPACWPTTPDELAAHTRRLVDDGELRARARRARPASASREFTWDRTAERTLDVLEEAREARGRAGRRLRERSRAPDTGRAAGLAGAVIAGNVIALIFTIVFARLLGASGYGTLGALLSTFIILLVPGSALQIAVAREVSAAVAAGDGRAGRRRPDGSDTC